MPSQDLVAGFHRPAAGEHADVIRPAGPHFPLSSYVQWCTLGSGRKALNTVLKGLTLLELDRVANAVVDCDRYHLGPLSEFGDRDGWMITTTDDTCTLQRDGDGAAVNVTRADVLLALELVMRTALEPWKAGRDLPTWVQRSREAHPRVVSALDGVELFESDA